MKRYHLIALVVVAILVLPSAPLRAQFSVGIGAGMAVAGASIQQAGGELSDFFRDSAITVSDVSGNIGLYVMLRTRFGTPLFRVLADVGYVYFQASEIRLVDANVDASDTTFNATFEVGTAFVPVSAGVSVGLVAGPVEPYIGAQGAVTFVSRTYTYISGSQELNTPELRSKSAGDPEVGGTILGGVTLNLGPMGLDFGLRYTLTNLLTKSQDEETMGYLQIGASIFF